MRIKKISIFLLIILFISSFIIIQSCRKDFNLEELDNTKDSMMIDGMVAVAIINTNLKLFNFIPDDIGDFWVTADDDGMLHIRMFKENLYSSTAAEIWNLDDLPNVPEDSVYFNSELMKLKINDNTLSGQLYVADPKFRLILRNEIPISAYFRIDTLKFYDGDRIVISQSEILETFEMYNPDIGGTYIDTIEIDTTIVPGLGSFFADIPNWASFSAKIGSTEEQELNELIGSEKLNIDLDIDLPLEIKLINLVMGDTSDMDWNEDIYEDVDSVIMKMKLANRFPFDGLLQIYFTADNDQGGFTIIDSIFTEQHSINSVPDEKYRGYWKLKGPGVDTYGFSIPEEVDTSKMSVTIDAERIEKMRNRNANKMIITNVLYSAPSVPGNEDYVRMRSSDQLGIKISFLLAGRVAVEW